MIETRPDRTSTMVGAVLGNYRITGALGAGGMGTVFRAQHELLGRQVAIKLLRSELTANLELVQRFFHEAKAATAIRHPGIIEVFDFGYTDEGRAYIVMEMLEGEPLAQRIAQRGRLTEVETAQIARGIASALTAAHGKGIVHRDLKPDNVFLVPDPDLPSGERPKVLDFGIAKLVDLAPQSAAVTQTGALMGTPLYMAPEQARAAGTIDHRADLYSLGCMMYEMLVGQPPFVAPGGGEIIAMQLFSPVQPPGERVAMSADMNRLVMRLLEKEPHARCQSAAEVVDALGPLGGFSGQFASASASLPRAQLSSSGIASFSDRQVVVGPAKRRSAMPIIAAVLTFALAGVGVAAFFVMTGKDADVPGETKPDSTRPAAAKLDSPARPEAVKPEVVKPEAVKPETVKPEVAKPAAVKPAVVVPKPRPRQPSEPASTKPALITSPAQIDPPKVDPPKILHTGPHDVEGRPIEETLDPVKKPTQDTP